MDWKNDFFEKITKQKQKIFCETVSMSKKSGFASNRYLETIKRFFDNAEKCLVDAQLAVQAECEKYDLYACPYSQEDADAAKKLIQKISKNIEIEKFNMNKFPTKWRRGPNKIPLALAKITLELLSQKDMTPAKRIELKEFFKPNGDYELWLKKRNLGKSRIPYPSKSSDWIRTLRQTLRRSIESHRKDLKHNK